MKEIHRRQIKAAAPMLALIASLGSTPSTAQSFLDDTPFYDVGIEFEIDPLLLYSVSLESSSRYLGNGTVSPSPYSLNSKVIKAHFDDRAEAEAALAEALKKTDYITVGLMQISLHFNPTENPIALLDPYQNLITGAQILKTAMNSTPDPVLGVGRFYSWRSEDAIERGQSVWNTYARLKAFSMESAQ